MLTQIQIGEVFTFIIPKNFINNDCNYKNLQQQIKIYKTIYHQVYKTQDDWLPSMLTNFYNSYKTQLTFSCKFTLRLLQK